MGKKQWITDDVAAAYIGQAKAQYHKEGTLEIDGPEDTTLSARECVSGGETLDEVNENGGMYVRGWVWVSNDSLPDSVQKKFGIKADLD